MKMVPLSVERKFLKEIFWVTYTQQWVLEQNAEKLSFDLTAGLKILCIGLSESQKINEQFQQRMISARSMSVLAVDIKLYSF